ncbi:hypothetical protein FACS1894195_3190 [Bacteroidia bacterium]|nr:hypothetical protein FACS1894195_3190 [Bacteroidia bacterium]
MNILTYLTEHFKVINLVNAGISEKDSIFEDGTSIYITKKRILQFIKIQDLHPKNAEEIEQIEVLYIKRLKMLYFPAFPNIPIIPIEIPIPIDIPVNPPLISAKIDEKDKIFLCTSTFGYKTDWCRILENIWKSGMFVNYKGKNATKKSIFTTFNSAVNSNILNFEDYLAKAHRASFPDGSITKTTLFQTLTCATITKH